MPGWSRRVAREQPFFIRPLEPIVHTEEVPDILSFPFGGRSVIDRGNADLQQVIYDILCLPKLNYNACIYGDGLPVTLRFSDMSGSILTAVDNIGNRVLPFKYYI